MTATSTTMAAPPTHQPGWILRRGGTTGASGARGVGGSAGTIGCRLSTLVICLVVAGTAIAVVTRLVTGEDPKPATDSAGNHRATPAPPTARELRPRRVERKLAVHTSLARRIRSGLVLILLLGFVGALAALGVGILALIVVGALRHAVG